MVDTAHIIQTKSQITAVIPLTIPRQEMQRVFGPAVEELMATLSAQGIAPAGPLFAHQRLVPRRAPTPRTGRLS